MSHRLIHVSCGICGDLIVVAHSLEEAVRAIAAEERNALGGIDSIICLCNTESPLCIQISDGTEAAQTLIAMNSQRRGV